MRNTRIAGIAYGPANERAVQQIASIVACSRRVHTLVRQANDVLDVPQSATVKPEQRTATNAMALPTQGTDRTLGDRA